MFPGAPVIVTWYRAAELAGGAGAHPPAMAVKLGGQLAVDAGTLGSDAVQPAPPLHGVGLGAIGANGHVVSVTGPFAASFTLHGT